MRHRTLKWAILVIIVSFALFLTVGWVRYRINSHTLDEFIKIGPVDLTVFGEKHGLLASCHMEVGSPILTEFREFVRPMGIAQPYSRGFSPESESDNWCAILRQGPKSGEAGFRDGDIVLDYSGIVFVREGDGWKLYNIRRSSRAYDKIADWAKQRKK